MKYYLLTFNQDWADEHNVPALACFTKEQYQHWLTGKLVTPICTPEEYETAMTEWNIKYEKYQEYQKLYARLMKERGGWALFTAEDNKLLAENNVSYPRDKPEQYESLIYAWLGNSGDNFGENFLTSVDGQSAIDNNIVKVTEVDKSFYDIFHKAELSSLSLCNIFEVEYED